MTPAMLRRSSSRREPRSRRTAGGGQAGMTLVEIMMALVVSTILVALVLSIFTRMSSAYRTQQQVSELQQVLQGARAMIQQDLRQTGYLIPQGFHVASAPNQIYPPVQIVNHNDGPDELRMFYADVSVPIRVATLGKLDVTFLEVPLLESGQMLLLVKRVADEANYRNPTTQVDADGQNLAKLATFAVCLVQIESFSGGSAQFSTTPPWGSFDNGHCDGLDPIEPSNTQVYALGARAYRIDPGPARKALGVLQVSPSGGLIADDWQDLGLGFTDFQIASRWYENDALEKTVDTDDLDSDPEREWFSGDEQTTLTQPYTTPKPKAWLLSVTFSFAVRTTQPVDGVPPEKTPELIVPARPFNNDLGDHEAFDLAATPDALRPEELRGNHVYRSTTARVDMRNLGVGL